VGGGEEGAARQPRKEHPKQKNTTNHDGTSRGVTTQHRVKGAEWAGRKKHSEKAPQQSITKTYPIRRRRHLLSGAGNRVRKGKESTRGRDLRGAGDRFRTSSVFARERLVRNINPKIYVLLQLLREKKEPDKRAHRGKDQQVR